MTHEARVAALIRLRYTPRQAAFLAMVAIHGGYFLRRQFVAFLGQKDGGLVTEFFQRLVARSHAVRHPAAQATSIFHLCSRPFYAALGDPNNRNRRPVGPAAVAAKLMTVDVVLPWRDRVVLGTEADKVAYFTNVRHVPSEVLPAVDYAPVRAAGPPTRRYFVDKAPIALAPDGNGLTFVYVQGWGQSLDGFATWLGQYRSLFARLLAVTVRYATTDPDQVDTARLAFSRFCGNAPTTHGGVVDPGLLLAHFRARQRVERGDLQGCDQRELDQVRADLQRFTGAHWQALYLRWRVDGDAAVRPGIAETPAPTTPHQPQFDSVVLRQPYPLLTSRERDQ